MSGLAKENSSSRIARLALRATIQQQALIRRAAEITHKSMTEFVLDSACSAAENVLTDQRLFLLDDAEYREFQRVLDEPPQIKPGLKKLIEENAPWE